MLQTCTRQTTLYVYPFTLLPTPMPETGTNRKPFAFLFPVSSVICQSRRTVLGMKHGYRVERPRRFYCEPGVIVGKKRSLAFPRFEFFMDVSNPSSCILTYATRNIFENSNDCGFSTRHFVWCPNTTLSAACNRKKRPEDRVTDVPEIMPKYLIRNKTSRAKLLDTKDRNAIERILCLRTF